MLPRMNSFSNIEPGVKEDDPMARYKTIDTNQSRLFAG